MIIIEQERLEHIPTLIVVDAAKKDEPLPIITYYHGFTSAKEHNLPFAFLMAQKGYRVLLPDSKHHGERDEGKTGLQLQLEFWNIIHDNLKELKVIKDIMDKRGLLLNNRFGVAGTSMGGITTSSAFAVYPWIKVAGVLMGSPKTQAMAEYTIEEVKKLNVKLPYTDEELQKQIASLKPIDLSVNLEKLMERPLFFWHGDADPVVPFEQSYTFYEEAKKLYVNKDNITFIREKGRGHKVSRFAILEAVKWFENHL